MAVKRGRRRTAPAWTEHRDKRGRITSYTRRVAWGGSKGYLTLTVESMNPDYPLSWEGTIRGGILNEIIRDYMYDTAGIAKTALMNQARGLGAARRRRS